MEAFVKLYIDFCILTYHDIVYILILIYFLFNTFLRLKFIIGRISVSIFIYLSKRSNLKTHVMSKKHRFNKGKLKKIGKREEHIVQALQKYDQEHHPKGETLSTPTRVFRMKVVQAFLKSGTLLNRLEFFREIFEEAGMSLSSSCNIH